MAQMNIDVDKNDAQRHVEERREELSKRLTRLVEEISEYVAYCAFQEAPYRQYRGGELRDKINVKITGDFQRLVTSDVPYLPYVIKGTRPHEIRAVRAKALGPFAFGTLLGVQIGGHISPTATNFKRAGSSMQFFKSVQHPGTMANDFLERASIRASPKADKFVEEFAQWLVG